MHRLFVAIRPPQAVLDLLIDTMEDGPELGWVSEDNLHLTLRFIGEVERPQANDIADQLSRIRFAPFEIAIRGTGRFHRKGGGGALWAGIDRRSRSRACGEDEPGLRRGGTGAGTTRLSPACDDGAMEARGRSGGGTFERRHIDLGSEPFAVEAFILFESHLSRHGARYVEAARFSLENHRSA